MCVHGGQVFDGPADSTSVQAMAAWHINAVRVPLNEDCWLGINGVSVGERRRLPDGDRGIRAHAAVASA